MKYKGFPISLRNNFSLNLKLSSSIAALLVISGGSTMLLPQEVDASATKQSIAQTTIAQDPVASSIIYVNPQSGTDADGAGTNEATAY